MKNLLYFFLFLWSIRATGQDFITTWKTDNPGISASNQITIPTTGTGYSYSIHWEKVGNAAVNGTIPGPITGNRTITFPSAGTYRISITGAFPRIYFNDFPYDSHTSDHEKILTVEQWGTIGWTSMNRAFMGCTNLTIPATDAPNLTQVTDMSWMLSYTTNFNQPIEHWDVATVTDMHWMFGYATSFNQPIGAWDVGNVSDMSNMFVFAANFNQPIGAWDVNHVNDMSGMFEGATNFNQAIGIWDVSSVKNMNWMFAGATNFNQPIGTWDVSNVTDMSNMFASATSFNQPIGTWDVSNVTEMSNMFASATNFNQPIGAWDVGSVTNMNSMFGYTNNFNQPIGSWDVSSVKNMSGMFAGATDFNQSIGEWDVSNVTDMSWMFYTAASFNQPIGAWNVSSVTNMHSMFNGANNFNQPIGAWDVGSVTAMGWMFYQVYNFNQPIGAWNVGSVTDMSWMFGNATNFNQPIETWDVSGVMNMSYMFYVAVNFNLPIGAWDVSSVLSMNGMFIAATNFNQPIGSWDVSSVTDMSGMFGGPNGGATNFNQPLEAWDVSGVTNMSNMFELASSFNQPIGTWDVSNVTDMSRMLYYCGLDVNNYDQTLIGWAAQNVETNVPLGAIGLKYCLGAAARSQLINNKGWAIDGDIKNTPSVPAVSLTQPICFGSTGTITVTIQNADETYSFDNGATFQGSNTLSGLVAGTYPVIIKNSTGCNSTAIPAVINPPFDLPISPVISGSSVVCPNVTSVDYSANKDQYNYTWLISGGVLLSQQNNKVKVDWGPSNFSASVKAYGKDQHNCPVDTVTFPVKIQIKLKPNTPCGMDSVCYNFRAGVPYQTSNTNGSVYTWFTDGGIVSEGQTTPHAKIDWFDVGQYELWVKEENTTSTDYCEGFSDTLTVTVFKDLAAITLDFVSVDYEDDKKVQIQWDATLLERISDLIIVSRRIAGSNAWEVVATLEKNVQSFLDQNVQTGQNIYEYKVEGFNKCDEGLQTVIHNTIKLDGDKDEEEELIDLSWNDYNGWDGVERYEVWRKLDGEASYKLIDITPGDITNYIGKHGSDGFVHMLRIKAKKKDENTISWSNEIELDFENPIDFIPNVITPNGDTKNEYFSIPRLDLYPENHLSIYNRWGEGVFMRSNYENNWNASGLPEGIYFYTLYIKKNNKTMKGWVQVVR